MNKAVCIVIPVYKDLDKFSANEICSLNRAYQVLSAHSIILTGPPSINWTAFGDYCKLNNYNFSYKTFPVHYFQSVMGYNALLFSNAFYSAFSGFTFMLIYQTDAYVFNDELEKWCERDFDYIGAPWFDGWSTGNGDENIIGAGNGGLSLRKISSFIKITKRLKSVRGILSFLARIPGLRNMPLRWIINPGSNAAKDGVPVWAYKELFDTGVHEDFFWAVEIPRYFPWFRVAEPQVAMYFSFENHPRRLFEMTNKLPFGCHAWEKYDPVFWSSYIQP